MKQFTLDLYENMQRPITNLSDWHNYDVMLDTGALFPIWVAEEETLDKLGAECVKKNGGVWRIWWSGNGKSI